MLAVFVILLAVAILQIIIRQNYDGDVLLLVKLRSLLWQDHWLSIQQLIHERNCLLRVKFVHNQQFVGVVKPVEEVLTACCPECLHHLRQLDAEMRLPNSSLAPYVQLLLSQAPVVVVDIPIQPDSNKRLPTLHRVAHHHWRKAGQGLRLLDCFPLGLEQSDLFRVEHPETRLFLHDFFNRGVFLDHFGYYRALGRLLLFTEAVDVDSVRNVVVVFGHVDDGHLQASAGFVVAVFACEAVE